MPARGSRRLLMSKAGRTIRIDPLTRIEGHGTVTIELDEAGAVRDSRFNVQEFRGFEKFCEGRMFWEMPLITPRICGVCPTSHHLASAKACDNLLGLDIPESGARLRELMHVAAIIEDHALHFFMLAGPDLLLGPDADPVKRNILDLVAADPDLARLAIHMRKVGQGAVSRLGGPAVHPVSAIPGGMSKPLGAEDRLAMLEQIDDVVNGARHALELAKQAVSRYEGLFDDAEAAPRYFAGLVGQKDELALYDGVVRVVDEDLKEVARFAPPEYADFIGEHVEPWSRAKFPYLVSEGFPSGCYRVGPLARLNVARSIGTPLAQVELEQFRERAGGKAQRNSLYYHWARMIELLHAAERMRELLADPGLTDPRVRVRADRAEGRGVGAIEAPRGLLIHDYTSDAVGRLTHVNLIVATTHNNWAINRTVGAAASRVLAGDREPDQAAFNHIETAIRCFDPCLSCSTHALGRMPLIIEVVKGGRRRRFARKG